MFNYFAVVFELWTTENNEVSSANNFAFDERPSARSLIYIKNRSGPSMEPWGTPALTSAQEEVCPLRTTVNIFLINLYQRLLQRDNIEDNLLEVNNTWMNNITWTC